MKKLGYILLILVAFLMTGCGSTPVEDNKDKDTDNYVIKISKNSGLPIAFYLELLNERLASHCGLSAIESKIFKYKILLLSRH